MPAVAARPMSTNAATAPTAEASAELSARPATAVKRRSRTGYAAIARTAGTATAASSAGHGTGRDKDLRGIESVRAGVSWVMKSPIWPRFGLSTCHTGRLVYAPRHTDEVPATPH